MKQIVLTPKQQRFCDEYLIDLNATQAALRAGYGANTALNGSIMKVPKVRYYLQQRTKAAAKKVQVSYEMLVGELSKIAFGNMGNYFRNDGTMKGMHELSDDEKAAIWSLKVGDSADGVTTMHIRMNSKLSAIEKLARHLGFYKADPLQPEKEYVYLDYNNMDDYDTLDDDSFTHENDAEEYYDGDDDEEDEVTYDTECRLAIAKAIAACKERKVKAAMVGVGEVAVAVARGKGSPEPGVESLESDGDESLESGVGSTESDGDDFEEDDVEAGYTERYEGVSNPDFDWDFIGPRYKNLNWQLCDEMNHEEFKAAVKLWLGGTPTKYHEERLKQIAILEAPRVKMGIFEVKKMY